MLVSMNEAIGMTQQFMGGIEINPDTLAVEVIDQIGPGGDFLPTDHTYRHYKTYWYPALMDKRRHAEWEQDGSKTLGLRANAKARQILETHHPPALASEVQAGLAAIIARAET
jgi:trimethylamine--corrinoid protein Co-methyltransferase